MSRSALIENVTAMLEDAGFAVSDRCVIRPKSFDVAARRGDDLLFVKILGNVDAFDGPTGAEMRRLGHYLHGTPVVIGLRTRDEDLERGVVYFRHGVPVISPDTALDFFVEGVPPLVYAAPGGLYVNIDGDVLADEREERGWSLGRLATELGVSRRTVSKYEDGMNASIDVAVKLEDVFDDALTSPVDVLDAPTRSATPIRPRRTPKPTPRTSPSSPSSPAPASTSTRPSARRSTPSARTRTATAPRASSPATPRSPTPPSNARASWPASAASPALGPCTSSTNPNRSPSAAPPSSSARNSNGSTTPTPSATSSRSAATTPKRRPEALVHIVLPPPTPT